MRIRTRTHAARLLFSPWIALAWAAVVFFAAPCFLATPAWLSAAPHGRVTWEIAGARGVAGPGQALSLPNDGGSTVVEDLDPEDDDDDDSDELSAHRRATSLDSIAEAWVSAPRLDLAQPAAPCLLLLVSSHLERAPVDKLSQTILRACSARGPPSA